MGGIVSGLTAATGSVVPGISEAMAASRKVENLNIAIRQQQYEQAAADTAQVARHRTRMEQLAILMGQQRAGLAASGLDPASGSGAALAVGATRAAFQESNDEAALADQERAIRKFSLKSMRSDRSLVPWLAGAQFAQKAVLIAASAGAFGGGGGAAGAAPSSTQRALSTYGRLYGPAASGSYD